MESLVSTLSTLVAFPTVSNRPTTAIAGFLAERAEGAGFRVEHFHSSEHKANVVATKGPQGTDGLVLSGHMDVVPVDGQAWSSDPFALVERDGLLFARGAADMKGFLAAVVTACERLPPLERELVLVWTHDEEVGCNGSAILAESLRARGRTLPRATWIGEPTSMRICRMHAGHTTLAIELRGQPAHSSRPQLGKNAITALGRVLAALEDLARDLARDRRFEDLLDSPFTLVNPGMVAGGTAVNIVPEHVRLDVGVRCLPGVDGKALVAEIARRVAGLDLGGVTATVRLQQDAQALLTREGTPLEAELRSSARTPTVGAVPFATDGGNLAALGTEPLVFGPGSIDVAHRPDEFVPAADLVATVGVVERVVRARCAAR
jgi:acetylornithine deacetylase